MERGIGFVLFISQLNESKSIMKPSADPFLLNSYDSVNLIRILAMREHKKIVAILKACCVPHPVPYVNSVRECPHLYVEYIADPVYSKCSG